MKYLFRELMAHPPPKDTPGVTAVANKKTLGTDTISRSHLRTPTPSIDQGVRREPTRITQSIRRSRAIDPRRFYLTLFSVFCIAFSAGALALLLANDGGQSNDTPARQISLTPHGSIRIQGNTSFNDTAMAEGWPGDGSASFPYIISGYEITPPPTEDGIRIELTDVHFIISDCYIHDGRTGILLSTVMNGVVTGNNCTNNSYDGIQLTGASDNIITSNNCTSNDLYGIRLYSYSNQNTISQNNCSDNYDGIYVYSSSVNEILDNNCSNNSNDGISLTGSHYNNMTGNLASNNTRYAVAVLSGTYNQIYSNRFLFNNGTAGSYNPAAGVQAYDDGLENAWNTSDRGNFWSDLTGPDANGDGIVDSQDYEIEGAAGAKDYFPLTSPSGPQIPEFGAAVIPAVGLLLVVIESARTRRRAGH